MTYLEVSCAFKEWCPFGEYAEIAKFFGYSHPLKIVAAFCFMGVLPILFVYLGRDLTSTIEREVRRTASSISGMRAPYMSSDAHETADIIRRRNQAVADVEAALQKIKELKGE